MAPVKLVDHLLNTYTLKPDPGVLYTNGPVPAPITVSLINNQSAARTMASL